MSLGLRRGSCVKLYHKQKCGANLVYLMEVVEDPNRINDDYSTPGSVWSKRPENGHTDTENERKAHP